MTFPFFQSWKPCWCPHRWSVGNAAGLRKVKVDQEGQRLLACGVTGFGKPGLCPVLYGLARHFTTLYFSFLI